MARDKAKDLGARLRALRLAAENARGPVADEIVDSALAVVERAGRRLEVSGDATVVALGGATGSGKSSTFNALSGTDLAASGVRRPTTRRTLAVSFGAESADELLDWLDVPNRHRVGVDDPDEPAARAQLGTGRADPALDERADRRDASETASLGTSAGEAAALDTPAAETAALDTPAAEAAMARTVQAGTTASRRGSSAMARRGTSRDAGGGDLAGLVLLDLPDHDSTEVSHRQEVDRMVELVDMVIWVVDPQKYADAALHDGYLKPLASYASVMMIVLNQIDRLTPAERRRCMADLRRLLDSEGLEDVEIAAISAATGEGVDQLRARIRKRVAAKKTAARRLATDIDLAAEQLAAASGTAPAGQVSREAAHRLNQALATAAGVPVVSEAVGKAWRHRGGLATGWPALAWIARFRPDPLRRLHLDRWGLGKRGREIDPTKVSRTSLPATTSVQRARVDSAIRDLADDASEGLNRGWTSAVRDASRTHQAVLTDQLDRSVATTDLGLDRNHGWWPIVKVVQWLLIAAVVAGLAWLGVAFAMLYLQLPPLPEIRWWGVPAPTVLVIGGILAGLLLALIARVGVEMGARRVERRARNALLASIASVTRTQVVEPANAELDRYDLVRENVERARRR